LATAGSRRYAGLQLSSGRHHGTYSGDGLLQVPTSQPASRVLDSQQRRAHQLPFGGAQGYTEFKKFYEFISL